MVNNNSLFQSGSIVIFRCFSWSSCRMKSLRFTCCMPRWCYYSGIPLRVHEAWSHDLGCEGLVEAWCSEERPAVHWLKGVCGEIQLLSLEQGYRGEDALGTEGLQLSQRRLHQAATFLLKNLPSKGSFNIMDDIIEKDRVRLNIDTYEGLAVIRSRMKTVALPRSLCLSSYAKYQNHHLKKKENW